MIAAIHYNEMRKIIYPQQGKLQIAVNEEMITIDLNTGKAGLSEHLAFCDTDRKSRKVSEGRMEIIYLPLYQRVDVFLYCDEEGYRRYRFHPALEKVYWLSEGSLGVHQRKDSFLKVDLKRMEVIPLDSQNCWVDGRSVSKARIRTGSRICCRAWTILVHDDFIAVNHPNTRTENHCPLFNCGQFMNRQTLPIENRNRVCRGFHFDNKRVQLVLKCPAILGFKRKEAHFSLVSAGSSVTMGAASLAVAAMMKQNSPAMLVMPCVMIFSVLFWPLVQFLADQHYNRKMDFEQTRWIQQRIFQWTQQTRTVLDEYCQQLEYDYPAGKRVEERILEGNAERRKPDHPLFALLCLGNGDVSLKPEICFENDPSQESKEIQNSLKKEILGQQISRRSRIEWNLKAYSRVGVVVDEKSAEDFLLTVIFSMALHHDPDDIALSWIGDIPDYARAVVHWLPHFRAKDGKIRHKDHFSSHAVCPSYFHWILTCRNYPAELDENQCCWRLAETMDQLDPQCEIVIVVQCGKGRIFNRHKELLGRFETMGMVQDGRETAVSFYRASELCWSSRKMDGIHQITSSVRPQWHENDCTESLMIPLGLQPDGQRLVLDLHEHGDGPHGLVAGMTGSGKSRLLQTLILSAAWHYSPQQLQFVLIDYKGGSCAELLKKNGKFLPHLCAVMNNIETEGLARSLYYLKQETIRRQKIFLQAQKVMHQAVCDLDQYCLLQRTEPSLKPLAHCVVIIDEFAELRQQQPQLLQDLIHICRIGRSLGMHLILATQRPQGIVDEQMSSNFNFRICLKVAQKQDSMDMIGCGDASGLSCPGEFFLKTQNSLIRGKGAWLDDKLFPDKTVSLMDDGGKIKETAIVRRQSSLLQDQWMLDQIIEESEKEKICVRALCPEPAVQCKVDELKGWGQELVIGQFDDLRNRCVSVLKQPYGSALVYGSSDTVFLYLTVASQSINACNGHLVILDPLNTLPQVNEENVAEQIGLQDLERMRQMLQWIRKQLDKREKRKTGMFVAICSVTVLVERMDCLDLLIRLNEEGTSLGLYPIFIDDGGHSLPSRLISPIRFRMVLCKANRNKLRELLEQQTDLCSTQHRGVVLQNGVYQMILAEPSPQRKRCALLWHLPRCPEVYPSGWFKKGEILLGADPVEAGPIRLKLQKDQCLWVIGFSEPGKIHDQMVQSGYPVIHDSETVSYPCILVCTVQQFHKIRFRNPMEMNFVLWYGPGLHQQMILPVPSGIREQKGMRYFFHYGKCYELQGEKNETGDHTLFSLSV